MKQKNKKMRAEKKRDLKLMLDSFMRAMTTAPSFDLRGEAPPSFDRTRSNGGNKFHNTIS